MKRLLITLSIILSPLTATAQWIPDQSQQQLMQQQMLEQQRQQTAAQQQMLMEMQQQRLQQQQQYNNCVPMYEPRRPLGSFIDGFNAGRYGR